MTDNLTLTNDSIEETMLIPLWARATFSNLYPDLLNDPEAARLIEKVDYDFSKAQTSLKEYHGLVFLARARNFDDALKEFIQKNPNATVVNIGCGLDTTFLRVDNGKIQWYNLDLPKAIAFRKQLIGVPPRSKSIAKSVLDFRWFDDVEFQPERGIFFLAGGLFMYFKEDEVVRLFRAMAERFPGGELIFDAVSKGGVRIANKGQKRTGIEAPTWHFGIGNPPKQFSKWSSKIRVVRWYPFWSRTPRDPKWKKETRVLMFISDLFKLGKFIQVKFL